MKKVLVTGGAGFAGSNLVELLINKKCKVNVIDNLSSGKLSNLRAVLDNKNFKFFKGNFGDYQIFKKGVKQCDTLIHMATTNLRLSIGNPDLAIKTNSFYYFQMLKFLKKHKHIKNLVYISSSEVYGDSKDKHKDENSTVCKPKTLYASSKLDGENLTSIFANIFSLKYLIIRPFNLFGKNSHLEGPSSEVIPRTVMQLLNNKRPYIYGDGNQKRDFCEISFVVTGIYKCMRKIKILNTKTINIGTGNPITINRLNKILAKTLGKKFNPIYLKEELVLRRVSRLDAFSGYLFRT